MPRSSAAWCIWRATLGRCSLISRPGTEVAIGLNSPPSAVPGFRSNVSLWLAPPSIHKRMHDFCLPDAPPARAARTSSQPDNDANDAPAAENLRKSRRDQSARERERAIGPSSGGKLKGIASTQLSSVVQGKFARVQQDPEDVDVGLAVVLAL